jgi:PAS domain S-box-containing protein
MTEKPSMKPNKKAETTNSIRLRSLERSESALEADNLTAQTLRTYLLAMESSVDGIAICGDDETYTFMNKAHAVMFGYSSPSELIGKHWSVLYDSEEMKQWTIRMESFSREGIWSGEAVATRKDGTKFPQEVSLTTIASGGIICVCRDISGRRESEEALRKATAELVRSNQELEQFAYIASHDLKEPLRMISSFVELVLEENRDALKESSQKYIKFIQEGTARMQILIRDLLAYSRVGRSDFDEALIDSSEVLRAVRQNLGALMEGSGAEILTSDLPLIQGSFTQLVRLFQNIVENAIKYRSDRPPVISIQAKRQNNLWVFSVADNGMGFNMVHHERIFQIFQRLHPRERGSGSGIGLAIAKKIVEGYGGRIWAESKEGEGSVFYFSLPGRTPGTPPISKKNNKAVRSRRALVTKDKKEG